MLDNDSMYKRRFRHRYLDFNQNKQMSRENMLYSPTFDMLRISAIFGL